MQVAKKKETYVKNLFGSESKQQEGTVQLYKSILSQNIITKEGLCFICTCNIGMINLGVKCLTCMINYHYKCLMKHKIYHDNFCL